MPATAAAQPVQQPTSAAQLLGAAAPLSTPGAAAGRGSAAAGLDDHNPGGIFDGLWEIQQEAELVRNNGHSTHVTSACNLQYLHLQRQSDCIGWPALNISVKQTLSGNDLNSVT
jgi:hypothetical protein